MNNYPNYAYGQQQFPSMTGYMYPMQAAKAKNSQPLTQEQIMKLRRNANALDMRLTDEDLWRAICTHKEKDTGKSTLVANSDGTFTCSICGATFHIVELKKEDVAAKVSDLTDILQTIKTIYLDGSEDLIKQFMQILPLLDKVNLLAERAVSNFSMYDSPTNPTVQNMPNYNGFNALNNIMMNPFAAQQPMYGYPQQMGYGYPQQPMYQQQPMQQAPMGYGYQQPMYQQPVDNGMNPMAYGAPQAPAVPVPAPAPQAAQQPQAAAPAAAPQAPVKEVQQQQVFNV